MCRHLLTVNFCKNKIKVSAFDNELVKYTETKNVRVKWAIQV